MRVGERYPAVLLMAGNKDDLVPAWNGCKMAAALQYATGGNLDKKVVVLRVLNDEGMGVVILRNRRPKPVWRSGCEL